MSVYVFILQELEVSLLYDAWYVNCFIVLMPISSRPNRLAV